MKMQPFCVGLTGGIGCGKSTVAAGFARLGVEVVDADVIAHELTAPNGAAMPAIIAAFGNKVVTQSGALDRAVMRARVFADPGARKKLEAILHPLIRTESIRSVCASSAPYVLLGVPLLAENLTAYRGVLHRIAVVDCDESQQLVRTAARPGMNVQQAKAILAVQASHAARIEIADDVVDNRGDMTSLDEQIRHLHSCYLKHAAKVSIIS